MGPVRNICLRRIHGLGKLSVSSAQIHLVLALQILLEIQKEVLLASNAKRLREAEMC
jgi:hypothetical protein